MGEFVSFPNAGLPPTDLDPAERLKVVCTELQRCREDLDRARYQADALRDAPPDVQRDADRRSQSAYRRWYEVQAQATALEAEVKRRQAESLQHFKKSFAETRQELLGEYGDLGPQYRLLIDRAAALHTRLKVLEQSDRDVPSSELSELHRLHLSYLAQLQRYTEAQKSEVLTQQTQDTVSALMVIIEHRLSQQYPQLWREVVGDVRKAIEAA